MGHPVLFVSKFVAFLDPPPLLCGRHIWIALRDHTYTTSALGGGGGPQKADEGNKIS